MSSPVSILPASYRSMAHQARRVQDYLDSAQRRHPKHLCRVCHYPLHAAQAAAGGSGLCTYHESLSAGRWHR